MSGTDPVDPAFARLLDDPAVWVDLPAGLRERTLAEALGSDDDEALIARPDFGRPRHSSSTPRAARPWQRPALLAAAAVVVLGLAVAGGLRMVGGGTETEGVEVALAGTENAPGATAAAELRQQPAGFEVTLAVDGLPPAPEGTFYEAWLVGEPGKVSAGTFHQRGDQDDIKLWLGVDPAGYDAITVTRQPVDGGTLAEGVVVLRGDLPPGN